MKGNKFIIEKVFVEVNTENMATATAIKDNIAGLMQEYLFPKLLRMLEEYNNRDKVIRIESLSLDLPVGKGNFNNEFKNVGVEQLYNQLEMLIGYSENRGESANLPENVEIVSLVQNEEELFLFFLENGYIPWHSSKEEFEEFLMLSNWRDRLEDKEFILKLSHLFRSSKVINNRLVLQLSVEHIKTLLQKINPIIYKERKRIFRLIENQELAVRNSLLKHLLNSSLSEEEQNKALYEVLKKMVKDKELIDVSDLIEIKVEDSNQYYSDDDEPFIEQDNSDGILLHNAGLILLQPFIKYFFKSIGILDVNGELKKGTQDIAVQSLHYVATGNSNFFEGDLIFEKFLCGIPLKMPVEGENMLTDIVKEESIHLLKEVIRQWTALKNSSPDDLRQMFIQRNGKLISDENGYRLIVERKAQDILLSTLNWNISLVKIPWSKELLYVSW